MNSSNSARALAMRRRQLDRELQSLRADPPARPASGWVAAIRSSIGMSGAQLAKRIGISQPSLVELEQAESTGHITLDRLQRAATALDCHVVYAVVPNKPSLEEVVDSRAEEIAQSIVSRVADSMTLEGQPISADTQRAHIQELKEEVLRSPRNLWKE